MILEIIRFIICWGIITPFAWYGFQLHNLVGFIPISFGIIWSIKYIHQLNKIYKQSIEEDRLLKESKHNQALSKEEKNNHD